MADQRKDRDQETRTSDTRMSDSYIPPSQLPMPNAVPGWRFRYVRTANLGVADVRNVSRRFREGYVPVVVKEHPELMSERSDQGSEYKDGLEIGGQLLCKIPVETIQKREKYQDDLAHKQLESVDHGFMSEQDPRMPKHNESKSRTQFRKG